MLKLPQNLLCPPFSMAKKNSTPLFVGVNLHMAPPPPYHFVAPPPFPVISDQSLGRAEHFFPIFLSGVGVGQKWSNVSLNESECTRSYLIFRKT